MTIRDRMRHLLEREPYPVGTRRQWKDGEHIKLPDGTWAEVSKDASPAGTNQNFIGSLTPDGKRWSLEGYVPPKMGAKRMTAEDAKKWWTALEDCLTADPDQGLYRTIDSQVALRTGIRSITEKDFGMVSRDVKFGDIMRTNFVVDRSPAVEQCWGTHDSAGLVKLSGTNAMAVQEFIARYKARSDPAKASEAGFYQSRELRGMKTLLHEEIHGASVINKQKLYHGAGAIFEEATTELAARKTLKEAFSLSNIEWSKVCNRGMQLHEDKRVGSYQSEIDYVWQGIIDTFDDMGIQAPTIVSDQGAQWWNDFAGAAAIAMRREDGRPYVVNDLDEALRRFVMALPVPDATWKGVAGKGKNPAQASDVEAYFKDKCTERIKFWIEHENETMQMLGTNWPPQRKTEAKELNLSPYQLKRNDLDGAINLAVRLDALSKLTPEVIQVLLSLQDNQKPLLQALNKILK